MQTIVRTHQGAVRGSVAGAFVEALITPMSVSKLISVHALPANSIFIS